MFIDTHVRRFELSATLLYKIKAVGGTFYGRYLELLIDTLYGVPVDEDLAHAQGVAFFQRRYPNASIDAVDLRIVPR